MQMADPLCPRRPGEGGNGGEVAPGLGDGFSESEGREDDAGDHWEVEVGVGVAGQAAGVLAAGDVAPQAQPFSSPGRRPGGAPRSASSTEAKG